MAFERFTEAARSYAPKVSLRASGSIGLNYGAVRKYGLDKFPFVLLFYDRQKRMVGIKPLKSSAEAGAVKLYHRGKNSSIYCRRFFDFFEIPKVKFRTEPSWDDKEGMLVFQIPESVVRMVVKVAS
jgi:hypothetical protein